MGRSQETFGKKENQKKKIQKRKDKEEKKEARQANSNKGKSLDSMMAYIDEYGNISDTPPDPKNKIEINTEDIQMGARKEELITQSVRKGIITFFNEAKGYGFIKDMKTQESIFVHINALASPVKENEKVTFEVERGPKGLSAVRVSTVKDVKE